METGQFIYSSNKWTGFYLMEMNTGLTWASLTVILSQFMEFILQSWLNQSPIALLKETFSCACCRRLEKHHWKN